MESVRGRLILIQEHGSNLKWDFRFEISGKGWIDNDTPGKDGTVPDFGTIGSNDSSIPEDAKVKVYLEEYIKGNGDNSDTLVKGYEIDKEDYSDWIQDMNPKGNYSEYSFGLVMPPLAKVGENQHYYSVRFEYNGQEYETTELLTGANYNDAERRVNYLKGLGGNTVNTPQYGMLANSSWVTEDGEKRKNFDQELEHITSDPIDKDGNTDTDDVELRQGSNAAYLKYKTDSKIATLNSNHIMNVSTKDTGYEIPIRRDPGYHLKYEYYGAKLVIRPRSRNGELHYPIQEYCQTINLGLVKRDESDLSIKKDLYDTKIIINKQMVDATYGLLLENNNSIDIQKEGYKAGIYSSDIEYRSNIYNDTVEALKKAKEGTELRVFATYIIKIENNSSKVDAKVNKITDYYDETFTLVDKTNYGDDSGTGYSYANGVLTTETAYVESDEQKINEQTPVAYATYARVLKGTVDGKMYYHEYNKDLGFDNNGINKDNLTTSYTPEQLKLLNKDSVDLQKSIAEKCGYSIKSASGEEIKWKHNNDTIEVKGNVLGTDENDNIILKSSTTDLGNGVILYPGESMEVFVTYEIDKEGFQAKNREINNNKITKTKNTITEITDYSTFYTRKKSITSRYSIADNSGKVDKDSAAGNINIGLPQYFEDDTAFAPKLELNKAAAVDETRSIHGTVLDETNNNGISNIPVSLIEKYKVDNDSVEYEFVHRGIKNGGLLSLQNDISSYGDETVYYTRTDENGKYKFDNIPPGIYSVRFEYGANNDMIDKNNNIEANNYKYNGQDYQNGVYKDGTSETLKKEFEDMDRSHDKEENSDARDYEPARLRTIAYSRTIANENAEVLASKSGDTIDKNVLTPAGKMLKNTYMRADTPKLNLEVYRISTNESDFRADVYYDSERGMYITHNALDNTSLKSISYNITGVDFHLKKRPETKIELDKRLTKITLTKKDDSTEIFDTTISYNDDGTFANTAIGNGVSTEGINVEKLVSVIDQNSNQQGFRYIKM